MSNLVPGLMESGIYDEERHLEGVEKHTTRSRIILVTSIEDIVGTRSGVLSIIKEVVEVFEDG